MVRFSLALFLAALLVVPAVADPAPGSLRDEFPKTDFSRAVIDPDEITSGGPPRDGIPSIDEPVFRPVSQIDGLDEDEPVIGLEIDGAFRAYPLRVMMWHEIVNDRVGDVPVAVTYCPLCNAAVVFDRRHDGKLLDFGTTGRLRHSDLIMYDRQTESWWQQFTGRGLIGRYAGDRLKKLPARIERFADFAARATQGLVLVPNDPRLRDYGRNPYERYDRSAPFLFSGVLPPGIEPMKRVVSLGSRGAWSLDLIRREGRIELDDGIVMQWAPGQRSALDRRRIDKSRRVGGVIVTGPGPDGDSVDIVHGVDFAFAYHAFYPDAPIHD